MIRAARDTPCRRCASKAMSSCRRTACWRTPTHVMPDELKFEGDKQFFTAALDRADLIVHGRHSFEDQPNSPRRKRIILTATIGALAPDPVQSQSHPVESGGRARSRRPASAPASHPARSRSSADPTCSACSWIATTRSGCRRRRMCDSRWRALLPRRARAIAAADSGRAWPDGRRTRGFSMRPTTSASRRGSERRAWGGNSSDRRSERSPFPRFLRRPDPDRVLGRGQ